MQAYSEIQQPKESESSVFKVAPPPALSQKPDSSPLRFFSAWHFTSLVTSFSAWCSSAHTLSPTLLYSGCVRGEGQPRPALCVSHFGRGCLLRSLCLCLFPVPHLSGWKS